MRTKRIYEDREIWKEYALLSRNGICREYALFGIVLTQIWLRSQTNAISLRHLVLSSCEAVLSPQSSVSFDSHWGRLKTLVLLEKTLFTKNLACMRIHPLRTNIEKICWRGQAANCASLLYNDVTFLICKSICNNWVHFGNLVVLSLRNMQPWLHSSSVAQIFQSL